MARRLRRKYDKPQANKRLTDADYRLVMDRLLQGQPLEAIALFMNREARAVEKIYQNILSNYSEDGKRQPALDKLQGAASILDYDRAPTRFDRIVCLEAHKRGRGLSEICLILHLHSATADALREEVAPTSSVVVRRMTP